MTSERIPKHIAIIPDGNRRWARARSLEPSRGHQDAAGKDHIVQLLEEAQKIGVTYVSIWVFSTENWRRSAEEKRFLFDLLLKMVREMRDYARSAKIKFRHIGRKDRLPRKLIAALENFEKETEHNNGVHLQMLMDYGGRDDIVRAVEKIVKERMGGKDSLQPPLTEEAFLDYLDTAGIPSPDLIIRTGGEKRLSGFLLYQMAYSELYFTEKLFPDFDSQDLLKAVNNFSKRKRNFGH